MADANTILKAMWDNRDETGAITVDYLCRAMLGKPLGAGDPERKQIIKVIGGLASRGLVKSRGAIPGSFPQTHAGYEVTTAGAAFISAGKVIKPGPRAGRNAPRDLKEPTFKSKIWKALRFQPGKKGTVAELVEIAEAPGNVKTAMTNAPRSLKELAEVGITAQMALRAKGFALTSNGFIRYAIVRDLGPEAPVVYQDYIHDPNSGERIPRPRRDGATSKTEAA